MKYKKTKNYISSSVRHSKKHFKRYKNFNLIGGSGINPNFFNTIKDDLKLKMIEDINILKEHTKFKTKENIEAFFTNIEKLLKQKIPQDTRTKTKSTARNNNTRTRSRSRENDSNANTSVRNNNTSSRNRVSSKASMASFNASASASVRNTNTRTRSRSRSKENDSNANTSVRNTRTRTRDRQNNASVRESNPTDITNSSSVIVIKILSSKDKADLKQSIKIIESHGKDKNDKIVELYRDKCISKTIEFHEELFRQKLEEGKTPQNAYEMTHKILSAKQIKKNELNRVKQLFKQSIEDAGDNVDKIVELYKAKGENFNEDKFRDIISEKESNTKFSYDKAYALSKNSRLSDTSVNINNVPSFINDISSNNDIKIWIIIQYIVGHIIIDNFFDESLKTNIAKYLQLKSKTTKTKLKLLKLQKKKPKTDENLQLLEENKIIPEDEPMYLFKSIISDKLVFDTINSYELLIDYLEIEPVYTSDILDIYKPKNSKEAIKLGENTKWCTAVKSINNMFNTYIKDGPIYTIIINTVNNDKIVELDLNVDLYNGEKYQLQKENSQYMNKNNFPINMFILFILYPDIKKYFDKINKKIIEYIIITNENYYLFLDYYVKTNNSDIDSIIFSGSFNIKIEELITLSSLKTLTIDCNILPVKYLICPDLKELTLNININESLNDSLNTFSNLEKLNILSIKFNKPLDNSLDNLINLKILNLSYEFDYPLENSLNNLTNLEELKLGYNFNQPLDNSLDKLTNLKHLLFGNKFNHPLGNSLDKLEKLEYLMLSSSFNHPLYNSLNNLTNLEYLLFGISFNHPLDKSLDNLVKLQELKLSISFNHKLDNSLDNLVNLKKLKFVYKFNQPLDNSLDKLTNLEYLSFSVNFNQPLGNSLDKLTKLKFLKFHIFNHSLGNSLDNLINLEELILGYEFEKPLETSLDNLLELKILEFGEEFNVPFYKSLDKLKKLEMLLLSEHYKQPIGNSFDNLINLKEIHYTPMNLNFITDMLLLIKTKTSIFVDKYKQDMDNINKFIKDNNLNNITLINIKKNI